MGAAIIKVINENAAVSENIACGSTNVGYSNHFILENNRQYGLEIQFTSDGAVNVKIELEQGNSEPTANAADSDWAVPADAQVISSGVIVETIQFFSVPATVTKYARFKLTGLSSGGGNHASTVCSKLVVGEIEA